ncbi:MAG: 16S rRNA (uracil(1498)-N(3))-methyltransferase [Spongiibacteraceae bacterium]|nr:16S rRNA (uracil(1498)-N(3))-methyltransferase [Spongiibacteraceae bacterium]
MRISRIYTQANLQAHSCIELEAQASHYLGKVLRIKLGASVILFNGKGGQFEACVASIDKKHITLQILNFIEGDCESPLHIHLGIAISRGERMDHIMQKTTELGVSEITPLFSERSEVKIKGERLEKKLQHWRNIIVNACEQCGRNQLPKLNTANTVADWASFAHAEQKLVLHHRTNKRLDELLTINNVKPKSVILLIGPEGGLSQKEVELVQNKDFNTLSLGPRVLRTETAPLAAITLLQHRWGDM